MRKVRIRFSGRSLGAMLIGFALVLAACSSGSSSSSSSTSTGSGNGKAITVGSVNFAGGQILSAAYGDYLQSKGYKVNYKMNLGTRQIVFPALQQGDIDLYGEFQGSLLENQLHGTATSNTETTHAALVSKLQGTGVVATNPAPAIDVNGFYVMKPTAEKYHLTTLSSLVPVANQLVFGGPPECVSNAVCLGSTEQQLYGLNFKSVQKLDSGGPVTTTALQDGTIQVGLLFTGSSVIPKDAVLLTDDKGLQPADNALAVVRTSVNSASLDALLNEVSSKLTTDEYNKMSLEVSNDKEDPATVAHAFLVRVGLVKS